MPSQEGPRSLIFLQFGEGLVNHVQQSGARVMESRSRARQSIVLEGVLVVVSPAVGFRGRVA